MANGDGQSKAPYIIICNGRIEVLAAKTPAEQLVAASRAAMRLTSFYDQKGWLDYEDSKPISDLQHRMMDLMNVKEKGDVQGMVTEMFEKLDALEKEYSTAYGSD